MLDTLISSKTRIKLLLKFFLNNGSRGYLRSLATEFGESTNSIRLELNKFEKAGMLKSVADGNKKIFFANVSHPLFDSIQDLMRKYVGLDKIAGKIGKSLGNLEEIYLIGDYAEGRDSGIVELLLIGTSFNENRFKALATKVKKEINREIKHCFVINKEELHPPLSERIHLLLWEQ